MVLNLKELADSNAGNLETLFEQSRQDLTAADRKTVDDFAEWVASGCHITINVKLFVVADIIAGGRYLNMYERADTDAALFDISRDELLKKNLGSFYERRTAFNASVQDGEKYYYGALTPGPGGLQSYDPYCLQLIDAFPETAAVLAYLPGDSLLVCFAADGKFDAQVTSAIISPHSHRHIMAATTRASQAIASPKSDWPTILNSKLGYIEVIFIADVTLSKIDRIQIQQAEYDRLLSIAMASLEKKLDAAELNIMYFFRRIMVAQRDNVVKLDIVP